VDINKDKIKKPKGIYLIGSLILVLEVYSLIIYFWIVGYRTNVVYYLGTMVLLTELIFGIIASIGLLRFKIWGRICMLIFCFMTLADILINKIVSMFWPRIISGGISLHFLILSVVTIVYLFNPKIKAVFEELNRVESPFHWH